jgi:membrane protease YdiL (CAAX protease family)
MARQPLISFFALAFGLTWSFLIADALGARGIIPFRLTLSGLGLALTLLMSYGPTIAALVVAGAAEGKAGIKALLGGVVRWRVSLGWYVLALGGPAALFFIAARLSELLGGAPHAVPAGGWNVLLMGIVGSLVHGIVNGEELGWRGYALPRLLQRHSALNASLILGVIWFAFHVPIMFVPNSIAGGQSFDTALPFLIGVLSISILATWIYRSTGGSVLLLILFHGAFNAWPGLLGDGGGIAFALQVIAAVVVVAVYGPAHLRRRQATA